ncbi:hypothetical protein [Actinophytocola glycyrrhizae]|uniref:Uncharacterized protein n=1 Tax=Actinophytocola glycyrrhizae TaxID=2044873 RepID=A0ABV9RVK9_9PSEU
MTPASHRRPPARGAQFAKLASIGVASAVLCGAVTVSSMIAQQRREHPQSSARPALQITGDQALLPDRIDRTLPTSSTPAPLPPRLPTAVEEATAAPRSSPATTAPDGEATTPVDGTTASGGTGATEAAPASDLELVRAFYENLPDAPATAFQLLSPDLLNSGLGEFLRSWSLVVAIDSLDVVQRADGVLATVRMRLLGGGHLHIQQLLTVAESPRRIVGAQLLSAQRN